VELVPVRDVDVGHVNVMGENCDKNICIDRPGSTGYITNTLLGSRGSGSKLALCLLRSA
jgi:hypothetical protein